MRILSEGNQSAGKLIRQKKPRIEKEYRLSLYAYPFSEGERYLLLHTMTGEVLELMAAEWAAILPFQAAPQSWDQIVRNGLTELAEKRYLVETDYDEAHAYAETLFLLRTTRVKKGLSRYVILPTTGCNARCVYCFEQDMPIQNMTEETADRLVDYICETKAEGPVLLSWFGGEPLVRAPIIHRICAGLEARGVEFSSMIFTNASLMTRELASEAKKQWHLNLAYVALDGPSEDYAARKRYVQPEKHNYDAVMRAIRCMAEEGIRVILRVNVDMENLPRMEGFLDEMGAKFGELANVNLHLVTMYQEQEGPNIVPLEQALFALRDRIRALGLGSAFSPLRKVGLDMRVRLCMAHNLDSSVVIAPDGRFFDCDHMPEGRSWGNIFDGVTDQALFDALRRPREIDPDCAKCPFLPRCTPYRKHDCPTWFDQCHVRERLETEDMLRLLLRGHGDLL